MIITSVMITQYLLGSGVMIMEMFNLIIKVMVKFI